MAVTQLKKQIAELTAAGNPDSDIAEMLDITPGYVSQIKTDRSYQNYYAELTAGTRITKHEIYSKIDDNYDKLEEKLTAVMVDNFDILVTAMAKTPEKLVNWASKLNAAKRRASGEATGSTGNPRGAVTLILPSFIVQASKQELGVIHNENQEIVEIDGRTLLAMDNRKLAEIGAAERQAQLETTVTNRSLPNLADSLDYSNISIA